jgi:DNA polymerase-3 subunit beta
MHFDINQKDLRAVSLAMAVKDIRYYLQGVYIEANGAETRLIATDGHRLHMVIQEESGPVVEPVTFIMPADMVKKCLTAKASKADKCPKILVTYDQGKICARLPDGSEIVQFALDGKFPDYRRIIPAHDGGAPESCIFNPDYVSDAIKGFSIYAEMTGKTPPSIGIRPRGANAGVLCCDNFLAVVMPLRGDISPMPAPKFSQELKTPVRLQSVA